MIGAHRDPRPGRLRSWLFTPGRSRIGSTGLEAIDAPCFEVHDAEVLATELAASVALGFTAKAAIHPGQIGPINAALSPSPQAVEEASRLLVENEKGVGTLDGKMIDEAMARRARRTLAKAGLSGAT